MKTLYIYGRHVVLALFIGLNASTGLGQTCSLPTSGQNLIPNGNFSAGNTGFTTDYVNHTTAADVLGNCASCFRNWSMPNEYMVGSKTSDFHFQFLPVTDVTPSADNNFLMVDGSCEDKDAWKSSVNVIAGVTYYFEAYIASIASGPTLTDPNLAATVQFYIAGVPLGTATTASTTVGSWTKFTASYVAPTTGSVNITIKNEVLPTTNCTSGNDYALDDITFTPGCAQGSPGPIPNLGADRTICGTGGSITLNANAPGATRYKWSPGGQTTSSITITAPGTYSVCVDNGVSCPQGDQIVISNTFSVSLPNATLCDPMSFTLDAQHSGVNVKYRWYKEMNGVGGWQDNAPADTLPGGWNRTYTVTSPGTYRVVVTDPSCPPAKEAIAVITSEASATPKDVYFCAPPSKSVTLSVNGTGNYNWFTTATGGSKLNGAYSNSFTTPPLSASTTYYVEDDKVYNTSVGLTSLNMAARQQTQISDKYMIFEAKQPLTIDSLTVYFQLNNFNANDPISIQFRLFDNPSNYNTTPATLATGPTFSMTNTSANAAGLISPPWPTKADGIYAVRVPVKLNVASAGMYRLGVASQNPTNTNIQGSGAAYNYNDVNTAGNVITINQSKLGNNPPTATEYHGMFNWKVLYKNDCQRVPVRAILLCPLPVGLIDFTASASSGNILLSWATAWEKNNEYFMVERSLDGTHFEAIGRAEGKGNSSITSTYMFNDPSAPKGNVYYRLAQYDIDGTMSYSPVRMIHTEKLYQVFVNPNPNTGSFNVSFQGVSGSEVKLRIFNTFGQVVYEETVSAASENFSKDLNVHHLPTGIYFLHLEGSDEKSITKIVKE